MYLGERKLAPHEISHIRASYPDFNLAHLYNSDVQLLGYWTRHNFISSDTYEEYKFYECHFMFGGDFDFETKNVFNLTKNIPSKEEKVVIQNIENIIDAEKVKLKTLSEKICKKILSRFIHHTCLLYDQDNIVKPTYVTASDKNLLTYSSLTYLDETKSNDEVYLMKPPPKKKIIRFNIKKYIYKDKIELELAKIKNEQN